MSSGTKATGDDQRVKALRPKDPEEEFWVVEGQVLVSRRTGRTYILDGPLLVALTGTEQERMFRTVSEDE